MKYFLSTTSLSLTILSQGTYAANLTDVSSDVPTVRASSPISVSYDRMSDHKERQSEFVLVERDGESSSVRMDNPIDYAMIAQTITKESKIVSDLAGKDLVVFLGATGAGKSTLVNCLSEVPLCVNKAAIRVSNESAPSMKIDSGDSVTRAPQYMQTQSGLYLCDFPGFKDTNGSERRIVNSILIKTVLEKAASIKFVFVANKGKVEDNRGQDIREFFCDMSTLYKKSGGNIQDHSLLVVTKTVHPFDREKLSLLRDDSNNALGSWFDKERVILFPEPKESKLDDLYTGIASGVEVDYDQIRTSILDRLKSINPRQSDGEAINATALVDVNVKIYLKKIIEHLIKGVFATEYESMKEIAREPRTLQEIMTLLEKYEGLLARVKKSVEDSPVVNLLRSYEGVAQHQDVLFAKEEEVINAKIGELTSEKERLKVNVENILVSERSARENLEEVQKTALKGIEEVQKAERKLKVQEQKNKDLERALAEKKKEIEAADKMVQQAKEDLAAVEKNHQEAIAQADAAAEKKMKEAEASAEKRKNEAISNAKAESEKAAKKQKEEAEKKMKEAEASAEKRRHKEVAKAQEEAEKQRKKDRDKADEDAKEQRKTAAAELAKKTEVFNRKVISKEFREHYFSRASIEMEDDLKTANIVVLSAREYDDPNTPESKKAEFREIYPRVKAARERLAAFYKELPAPYFADLWKQSIGLTLPLSRLMVSNYQVWDMENPKFKADDIEKKYPTYPVKILQ